MSFALPEDDRAGKTRGASGTSALGSEEAERTMKDVGARREAGETYSRRLEQLRRDQSVDGRRERWLGYCKITLLGLIVVAGALYFRRAGVLEFLLAPFSVFVIAAVLHERVLRAIRLRERPILFYERGLARLENRWAGTGEPGERFFDASHPYARDLDIFGKASVFELLCTVRTRAGEETLARWLLAGAPVTEILARQDAVRDLTDRLDFRERLFVLGETVRLGVRPEALSAWGERSTVFKERSVRIVTTTLSVLWILSLVCWGVWGRVEIAVGMTLLNLAWAHRIHQRLEQACGALVNASDDLEILAGVVELLEGEQFSAAKLVEMQAALRCDGIPCSAAIRKLVRLARYASQRENLILRWLEPVTFWSAHGIFAAERWQRQFGPQIRGWVAAVGECEALSALAGYAFEHPADVFPEFSGPEPLFDADGLAHPLLPPESVVRNDVKLGHGMQLMILSGPNMAGKSTFIRSVGVNAVLAQCGAPVRAARLKMSPLAVAASICILDSLFGGVSRFYAEIYRVKLVSDMASGEVPVLFLLDELLSGTNSHDRLEGTKFVVRSLTERGAIGIVSTHDLALTRIPETMGECAINYHFEDRVVDGRLAFDYMLKPGVVETSNALELMRSIGLGAG